MTWRLKRTKQCTKCPWRVATNPHDIPNGYNEKMHEALKGTIAKEGAITFGGMRAMACHESPIGAESHCIGWLVHQLGIGNNVPLRLRMRDCENASYIAVDGEQHERFEDTLPKRKRRK